jgi:glycosyltransferase involved in cell wall biosynthesis
MPAILDKVPNASLWIAGHDPDSHGPSLQRLIEQLNLENSVRLVGFQKDVPRLLQAIDVLAFPSRFEGFGLVALEAMAAGKPVVASRVAPLTEIVVDGETGILAEANQPAAFGDAVSWLLTHPDEAKRMGLEGRRRARESFSAERMAQDTLNVYESVLQRQMGS